MTSEQFVQLQTWIVQAYAPAIELWLALMIGVAVFMVVFVVTMISIRAGLSNFL